MRLPVAQVPARHPAPAEHAQGPHTVHLPAVGECVRQAVVHLAEGVLIPGTTFYAVLRTAGLRWALLATLLACYLTVGVRLARRDRVPGIVLLTAALFTGRTVLALAANSSFVYLVQPSVGNLCLAAAFLASLLPGKPLIRRLANDFCVLPDSLSGRPSVDRFFARATILWALIFAATGAGTLVLLVHQSVGLFLVSRAVITYGLIAAGILVSVLWCRATVRGEGLRLVFGAKSGAVLPAT